MRLSFILVDVSSQLVNTCKCTSLNDDDVEDEGSTAAAAAAAAAAAVGRHG